MHHHLLTTRLEQNGGIVPPPPGVTPNFNYPESRGYLIVIASIIFLALSTMVLLLRLYSRRFLVHVVNSSDYAIIVGQLSGIGFSTITLYYVANHTLGVHAWDIRASDLTLIMQLAVVQYAFLWLAIMFAKISILLFYLQLSPYKYFRVIIYVLQAITLAYSLLGAFAFLIVCRPIKKFWELTLPYGSCVDQRKIWLATAAANSATDITMAFLPILLLWHVSIPKRTKIGVIAILMTGVFVTATSFIRLHSLVSLSHSKDSSWPVAPAIWSTIEVNVGLMCASLPHAKPFLQHHFPKLFGNTGSSGISASQRAKYPWTERETLESSDEYATQLHGSKSDSGGDIWLLPQHPRKPTSSCTNESLHTVSASSIRA